MGKNLDIKKYSAWFRMPYSINIRIIVICFALFKEGKNFYLLKGRKTVARKNRGSGENKRRILIV